MMLKTNKLRDAITFALVAGTTAVAGTGVAIAQEDQQATTLDRIQVTGSRIRQVDVETAQPVTFVSREDIERQGFQSVADILQNIGAAGTPPISRASPLSAGETAGGTYISLRNFGPTRTLVLLNGRRMPITTSGWADISAIPAAAVERIEVLKDGASSIYGSDAIAGVVNIITRSNFEGATGSVYYGQYSQGDGAIKNGDWVMGFTGDRGSLTVAAEYREEDAVRSADRPFSAYPRSDRHPTDNWTPTGQFGGFQPRWSQREDFPGFTFPSPTASNPDPAGPWVVLRDGGDPRVASDYILQNRNVGTCVGATAATGCTPGSTLHKTNTNLQTDLRTPIESKGLFVDGVYDLTDNVRLRTNFLYSNRVSARTVAGYPMQAAAFDTPMSPDSYFNPTSGEIDNWWRRTWEVPRVSSADATTYRFAASLEGFFEIGESIYDWDVSYITSESKQLQNSFGNLNLANTRAAVGPSFVNAQGQVVCGTPGVGGAPDDVIAGCVPWNPFLHFGVAGPGALSGNQALQDYLFQEEHATGLTETQIFTASISGSFITLPAGDLGFALGVETRKEDGQFTPDALAVTAGSTNLASGPTGGGYRVDEAFLELELPILSDIPFAQELTLTAATRYSDFDTFGDTINNKFGLRWRPFESLLVRGTYADGFRAPTISDLYGGGSQTFSFFTDPCDTLLGSARDNATTAANCAADLGALAANFRQLGQGFAPVGVQPTQTPIAFQSGGNPLLQPELSKSQTIGFVWSPNFVEGLNVGVDWWKIRIADTIVADSPTTILNDCYVQGITSRCSDQLFTRDAGQGYINFLSFGGRNAGFRKAEGFDLDVSYRWDLSDYGAFTVTSNSSYTAKDYFVSTNDPVYATSSVGLAGSASTTFRVRSNLNLGWQLGDFGLNWMVRHYSSMKENCAYVVPGSTEANLECNEITYAPTGVIRPDGSPASAIARRNRSGSNTFNDVNVRWQAPWNATISVGANNVFKRYGPVMYGQPNSNSSYHGSLDIGRFVYMRYQQRF